MTRITRGTTNVFADLGYPDAAERQTKTRLALAVNEPLQFSVERLMEFLTALNQDVEITIRPRATSSGTGQISVLSVPQTPGP